MTIDLIRMRTRVRKPLGMLDEDDPDLTNTDIDEYLNMSLWELEDKFPYKQKEKIGTFQTSAGTRNYEMPEPFEALRSLSVVDPVSGQHIPLEFVTPQFYESNYSEAETSQAIPKYYIRENCFARLLPTPDDVYTIVMRRTVTLTDLAADHTTLTIPQVWMEIIIYGAVYRAFIDFGDFARAATMKQHQVALIEGLKPTDAKELREVPLAGLEVLGREY